MTIEPVLHLVDMVLVLTVNPGYSGQNFLPETLPKISQVRKMLDRLNPQAMIEVDGGITPQTLRQTRDAGAQVFVTATAVFGHPDGIAAGIESLRAC
jgi:ribulose-phosphate 3-epimerase